MTLENTILKRQLNNALEEIEQLKRMVAEMQQKKPKEEDIFSDDEPKIVKVAKPKLLVKKLL